MTIDGIEFTAEQARKRGASPTWFDRLGRKSGPGPISRAICATIAALGARYLERLARPHKRNLQNHIVPLIGALKLSGAERQTFIAQN